MHRTSFVILSIMLVLFMAACSTGPAATPEPAQEDPEPILWDSLSPVLITENQATAELITVIKIHKLAKYSMMVDIIDEIEVIEARFKMKKSDFSYRFSMAPWTNGDQKTIERVRAQYDGLVPAGAAETTGEEATP